MKGESFQKILLIQTAFIGDVILATGLIENLAETYPKAQIDILVRKGNEALLANNPHIKNVLIWNKQAGKYSSLFSLLKQIRTAQYDVVINTQRFGATGILTALSKAKYKSGFAKNPFSKFFNHRAKHNIGDGTHEIERNFKLIEKFTSGSPKKPKLYPSLDDLKKVNDFTSKKFVTISPQSVWYTKMYPAHHWVTLVNELSKQYQVYVLGGPGDAEANNEIISKTTTPLVPINLAGKLSFLQSAALMAKAEMNYVNDSGPLHLCSAVDAPVTAIFCSTIPEFGFTPLSTNTTVIQSTEPLTCRPCGLHGYKTCPKGHFKCGETISPDNVIASLFKG